MILEPVLISAIVSMKHYVWFTKHKLLILTNSRVIVGNPKNNQVRFMNPYKDILGITKSLRVLSKNFIVHIGNRPDEEWNCDHRDELIEIMQVNYNKSTGNDLPVFGVASPSLEPFITTQRDIEN